MGGMKRASTGLARVDLPIHPPRPGNGFVHNGVVYQIHCTSEPSLRFTAVPLVVTGDLPSTIDVFADTAELLMEFFDNPHVIKMKYLYDIAKQSCQMTDDGEF
jgi:hypothetical protein